MAIQEARYTIRPARKSECRRIAELYRISSDGIADYIWTKLAQPGEDILDVGRKRYEREGTPFSYRNCKVVELDESVVAMLVAFPMQADGTRSLPSRCARWCALIDPILVPYSVLEEDQSYYLCGMAVEEKHRGNGIGMMLLADAERTRRNLGLAKLSLIVFEQNVRARHLYEREGFVETRRHPVA